MSSFAFLVILKVFAALNIEKAKFVVGEKNIIPLLMEQMSEAKFA